jgi:hypothetical protein
MLKGGDEASDTIGVEAMQAFPAMARQKEDLHLNRHGAEPHARLSVANPVT